MSATNHNNKLKYHHNLIQNIFNFRSLASVSTILEKDIEDIILLKELLNKLNNNDEK